MREQLGPFNYDDLESENQPGELEQREMVTLEDGARYEGEWLKD